MEDARRMAEVFVQLADTLADAFDVVDFLENLTHRCVELLTANAAGLTLTDQRGSLMLMASTVERARAVEVLELRVQEGPCVECFPTGRAITNVDVVIEAGFGASHALPMRLRGRVIGARSCSPTPRCT